MDFALSNYQNECTDGSFFMSIWKCRLFLEKLLWGGGGGGDINFAEGMMQIILDIYKY